jgi:hypothetical protein
MRKGTAFGFTLMKFEPVYQMCCAAAMNQRNHRVVSQWLC